MNEQWKKGLQGFWLPVIGLLAYGLAGPIYRHLINSLNIPNDPGSDVPWYFIRHDFVQGTTMAGLGGVCVVIGLLNLKRYPIYAAMLLWQTVIWFGGPAWKALVIMMRTDHPLDPLVAKVSWSTFNAYSNDPIFWYGEIVTYVIAFLIALFPYMIAKRRAA